LPGREGAGGCDKTVNFNTGVLHLRATPAALEFVSRWHAKVTTADEAWMRDQPAFNLLARGAAGLNLSVANPERPRGDRALLWGADGLIKLVRAPALHRGSGIVVADAASRRRACCRRRCLPTGTPSSCSRWRRTGGSPSACI
jgi:hypothetical protein